MIHGDIRRIFQSKIESSTDKEGILVLTAASKGTRGRSDQNPKGRGEPNRLSWRERGGDYTHFNLYKENKDTMEVISFLSRQLKMAPKSFNFAGTKDRRGVTVQRVSAYRVEAGRLAGLNRSLRYAAVGDFKYEKHGLELGELNGNEFAITLRECHLGDDWEQLTESERIATANQYLSQSLNRVRTQGFLNFYGLQRFGSFMNRTDTVGLKILQGDFQGAVDAILQFSPVALEAAKSGDISTLVGQDDRARAEAINHWRTTGQTNETLDRLPRKFSAETSLIRHLGRQRNDYIGGLLSIQRNLRLMYVHAYQSLVFNLAVGERWRLFGNQVVEGDLVLVHEHKEKEALPPVDQGVDADGEVIIEPLGEDRAGDREDMFERARPISADEAAGGQYSIFDIVLPLPGFDVEYPANALGEWYKTFMASEQGGGLDPYNMRRKQKDFSLSGSYRKILARIGETYEVQVYSYFNEDQQFVKTDMDLINESKPQNSDGDVLAAKHEDNKESAKGPSKIAAVLKFQLGSSQYATMALRDLSRGGIQAYKAEFMGGR
jgi:tRNA pseudouridine13 synthase